LSNETLVFANSCNLKCKCDIDFLIDFALNSSNSVFVYANCRHCEKLKRLISLILDRYTLEQEQQDEKSIKIHELEEEEFAAIFG